MIKNITQTLKRLHITFLLFFVFSSFLSFAQVEVTKFSGGDAISADLSSGSSGEGFTTLGDFVLKANVLDDFEDGVGKTIILKAPENWEFNPGQGTIASIGGITGTSVNVSADEIIITFSAASVAIGDHITVSGIQVKAQVKTPLSSSAILRSGGTAVIEGFEVNSSSGDLKQIAGEFTKLLVLFPGETAAPGTEDGKTGTPAAQLAGVPFDILVNAVDENWNVITGENTVSLSLLSGDYGATFPSNLVFVNGEVTANVTLRNIQSTVISLVASNAFTLESNAISVLRGPFSKLQILLPGEVAAPGTVDGKTGIPTAQIAGTSFNVVVNAVDAAGHIVDDVQNDHLKLGIDGIDNDLQTVQIVDGVAEFNDFIINTVGTYNLIVQNEDNITIDPAISEELTVDPGTYAKLQLLLPGETAAPGTLTGKTGTPSEFNVGQEYTVRVNAVDENWNVVESSHQISIQTNESVPLELASATLNNGTLTLSNIIFKTAGTYSLNVIDIEDVDIEEGVSSTVTVSPMAFSKLQLLLPGETAAPGTLTGKTGTPSEFTVGQVYTVRVNAVDENWNVVESSHQISIQTNESVPLELSSAPLNNGTLTLSNIIFKTAGTYGLSAVDSEDANIDEGISSELTVNPGAFTQLQILLPGEVATPGEGDNGKMGYPLIPQRGVPFGVTVVAVDDYFNEVSEGPGNVTMSSSDLTAVIDPITINLINDVASLQINVNIKATGTETLTATYGANNLINAKVDIPLAEVGLHYKTITNGSWSDLSTWSSSADSLIWDTPPTRIPGPQDLSVNIDHNVTINDNTNKILNTLTINTSGTLELNAGKFILSNATVFGALKNAAGLELLGEDALTFKSGGKYQHNFTTTLGVVPQATWENGSTCEIIGYTTATGRMVGINGQSFYNLTWNSPNQNTVNGIGPSLGLLEGSNTEVRNNFTVESTGGTNGGFQLSTVTAVLNVKNYIQNGGRFGLINRNIGALEAVLNVSGDFTMTGGILQKTNGGGVSASKAKVVFNGISVQNFNKTAGTLNGNLNFEIASDAIVDFGTNVLAGNSGTFEMKEGASLLTKHLEGISKTDAKGNIQSTGTRIFSNGTNYIYNGEALQETGSGLPETVANLTIDNEVGVKLTAREVLTVTKILNVRKGFFDLIESELVSNSNLGNGILFTQNKGDNPLNTGSAWNPTVVYNAEGSQTVIDGNYKNLVLSGGGTKAKEDGLNRVYVAQLLSVLSSTKFQTRNGLVIRADLNNQGAIGPLLDDAEIIGNVELQRYMKGTSEGGSRGSKSMTSLINDNLITTGPKTYEQLKEFVIIPGPGGTDNGFDNSTLTSLVTYNESLAPDVSSFVPVTGITETVSPGVGFQLIFRGNKENMTAKLRGPVDAESVTLRYQGPINQGDISIPIGYTNHSNYYDGYFLTGNPYPAPLDANILLANSNNLNQSYTIAEGGKAYKIYNVVGGVGTNGASRYIAPGEGFYVSTNSSGGSLNFKESQKYTPELPAIISSNMEEPFARNGNIQKQMNHKQSNISFKKDDLQRNIPSVKRLIKMTLSSESFKDETAVVFSSDYLATADEKDSKYFLGYNLNLATLSEDGKSLAVNLMPDINDLDSLKLEVNSLKETNLRLQFNEITSISDRAIHLKDNYLDTLISINTDEDYYDFTLDKKIAETYGKSRFVLLFAKPIPPVVQPGNFQVKKDDNKSLLTWNSGLNIHGGKFEVERSSDSQVFNKIGEVNFNLDNISFSYIDQFPLNGNNYYRIKQIDAVESTIYSPILKLSYETLDPQEEDIAIKIYPNPVKEFLTVDYKSEGEQNVVLSIYNLQGQRLKRFKFLSGEPQRFSLSELKQGIYVMELKVLENNKVIVSRKFIKE
jgi:hypothetical protein